MLVRVERDRAAVALYVTLQFFGVGSSALARREAQLHQLARRIVFEDQQRTGLVTVFVPTMLTAIHLHKFAVAFAPKPWLM